MRQIKQLAMIKKNGKHLAIFIHRLSGGGAPRRTLSLVHAFAERGHRVDLVVVTGDGPLLQELSPQVRLVVLDVELPQPLRRLKKQRHRTVASIGRLAHYLRQEQPDILLSAASHVNLAALWARRFARVSVPLVLRASNHFSGSNWQPQRKRHLRRWMARRIYRWADAVIAVSVDVARDIADQTNIPKERITTIYNPTFTPDLAEKARAPLDHPWFSPGSPPVILGAGRFAVQKDFPTLIKAFARVRATRSARLIILGEGKQRAQVSALAQRLGVDKDVELPGYVDNPLAWMARASTFVLSSAWEGLPGVLIEALACGCPVVSTDSPGGAAEILANGLYGPLVPVRDDEALSEAILSTLDAPLDSARLQARAADFSVERAVNEYLNVLLGVAAKYTKRTC
jgi:glycosyltransferase involved in cell wall biosynthesis